MERYWGIRNRNPGTPPPPSLLFPSLLEGTSGWVCLLLVRHLALENSKGPGCGPQGIKAWFWAKFSGRVEGTGEVLIRVEDPLWN